MRYIKIIRQIFKAAKIKMLPQEIKKHTGANEEIENFCKEPNDTEEHNSKVKNTIDGLNNKREEQ